jgi:hypothetical protein
MAIYLIYYPASLKDKLGLIEKNNIIRILNNNNIKILLLAYTRDLYIKIKIVYI